MMLKMCAGVCVALAIAISSHVSGAAGDEPARETAGVGLALGKQGEDLVVNRVLPSSQAFADHSVGEGDRILAIAQGNQPAVEVKGLRLQEAVALIRGPKGTTVWLTIVPVGKNEARSLRFVRGELKELARWGDGVRLAAGTKAPDVRMVRLTDMKEEPLAVHAGKIVVLEFWSIGCQPCQKLMADLQGYPAMHPAWKDKAVLITVNVDDDRDAAAGHLKANGWNQTHNVWASEEALKAFHVNGLPTIYVIDQEGRVAAADAQEDIPAIVNRLVEGK